MKELFRNSSPLIIKGFVKERVFERQIPPSDKSIDKNEEDNNPEIRMGEVTTESIIKDDEQYNK